MPCDLRYTTGAALQVVAVSDAAMSVARAAWVRLPCLPIRGRCNVKGRSGDKRDGHRKRTRYFRH